MGEVFPRSDLGREAKICGVTRRDCRELWGRGDGWEGSGGVGGWKGKYGVERRAGIRDERGRGCILMFFFKKFLVEEMCRGGLRMMGIS